MTEELATRFAEFIKDHDKRFDAKARPDREQSVVLLTLVSDGTVLEPIYELADYNEAQIERNNPGPTVREAWAKWRAQADGR